MRILGHSIDALAFTDWERSNLLSGYGDGSGSPALT